MEETRSSEQALSASSMETRAPRGTLSMDTRSRTRFLWTRSGCGHALAVDMRYQLLSISVSHMPTHLRAAHSSLEPSMAR